MRELISTEIQRLLNSRRGITANQVLIEDLGFDSLKLFELVTWLQDHFDIAISYRDTQRIKTVGDIYAYVQQSFPDSTSDAPAAEGM
ncbi:acyl carrier protein [Streptomyces syringium]|uniref:acyl carrier protein n=1 Tax=Streptomyces syringium TaxID=76729 RepID=UPI003454647E